MFQALWKEDDEDYNLNWSWWGIKIELPQNVGPKCSCKVWIEDWEMPYLWKKNSGAVDQVWLEVNYGGFFLPNNAAIYKILSM